MTLLLFQDYLVVATSKADTLHQVVRITWEFQRKHIFRVKENVLFVIVLKQTTGGQKQGQVATPIGQDYLRISARMLQLKWNCDTRCLYTDIIPKTDSDFQNRFVVLAHISVEWSTSVASGWFPEKSFCSFGFIQITYPPSLPHLDKIQKTSSFFSGNLPWGKIIITLPCHKNASYSSVYNYIIQLLYAINHL